MQYFHYFVCHARINNGTFGGGKEYVVRDGNELEEVFPVLGFLVGSIFY
jgi:hypothetical protein